MRKGLLYAAGLFLMVCSACSEEERMPAHDDEVRFSASILPMRSTRVQVSDEGNGNFTLDDRVSLFVFPDGRPAESQVLTLTGNGWSPRMLWSDLQSEQAVFAALYPAVQVADAQAWVHEVAADQREEKAFRNSDLLYARTGARRGEQVQLGFAHQMNRVVVHLSSDGAFSDEELAAATVSLKAYRRIGFNLKDGVTGKVEGNSDAVVMHKLPGASFQAVVCPQAILGEWHSQGWMEIDIAGRKLTYKAPDVLKDGEAFDVLEGGKQVTFSITLSRSEAGGDGEETDWRNKTCWVYGLKNIPPIGQWGYYLFPQMVNGKPVNEVFALEWKPDYHWYDCNKKNPAGPEFGDQNMCWAATCSNMIYWWLENNADYIQRFGYQGPHVYNSDTDCEVFQFYKDHFTDKGLYIDWGLEWFFRGTKVPPSTNDATVVKEHPGFFNEVFKAPVSRYGAGGGYFLSDQLKKAFRDHEAMGLSLLLNKGTAAHAITIWGASFDDKGEVNMLYVCENNDVDANTNDWPMKPGRISNAGIFTKRVRIDEAGKAFVEGGKAGECSIEISNIIFLGLHRQEWESYFKGIQQ